MLAEGIESKLANEITEGRGVTPLSPPLAMPIGFSLSFVDIHSGFELTVCTSHFAKRFCKIEKICEAEI